MARFVMTSACLTLIALGAGACTSRSAYPAAGMTRRAFADSTRRSWGEAAPRPLRATVWYPAERATAPDTLTIGAPSRPIFLVGVVDSEVPMRA